MSNLIHNSIEKICCLTLADHEAKTEEELGDLVSEAIHDTRLEEQRRIIELLSEARGSFSRRDDTYIVLTNLISAIENGQSANQPMFNI